RQACRSRGAHFLATWCHGRNEWPAAAPAPEGRGENSQAGSPGLGAKQRLAPGRGAAKCHLFQGRSTAHPISLSWRTMEWMTHRGAGAKPGKSRRGGAAEGSILATPHPPPTFAVRFTVSCAVIY